MMCQDSFISCNKWTTLVGDVDNGGGYACAEVGDMGNPYVSLNYTVNLKLLFKKQVYFKTAFVPMEEPLNNWYIIMYKYSNVALPMSS